MSDGAAVLFVVAVAVLLAVLWVALS